MNTSTGMTPREALLQVAHLFETKPACYRFTCTSVPEVNNLPHWHQQACALGWVAFFAGLKAGPPPIQPHILEVAADFVGCDHQARTGRNVSEFYVRMDKLEGDDNWVNQADVCARILRNYADKFFPINPVLLSNTSNKEQGND